MIQGVSEKLISFHNLNTWQIFVQWSHIQTARGDSIQNFNV